MKATSHVINRMVMRLRREGWNDVLDRVVQEKDVKGILKIHYTPPEELDDAHLLPESFHSAVLQLAEEYGVTKV